MNKVSNVPEYMLVVDNSDRYVLTLEVRRENEPIGKMKFSRELLDALIDALAKRLTEYAVRTP
jgi:hypothetical protein